VPVRNGEHDRRRALPTHAPARPHDAGRAAAALHRTLVARDRERLRRLGLRARRPSALLGVHVPLGAVAPLVLVAAVTAFSCTGLGLCNAALGLRVRETAVTSNILFGFLLVFCGVNVPLSSLPAWMSTIAEGLPLTHGIAAARQLAGGAGLGKVAGLVGAELLIGCIYVVGGYALLRLMEIESRRRGTLEIA